MPLVFVHGVSTRRDSDGAYDGRVAARTEYFRTIVAPQLNGASLLTVENPYWGAHGAALRWKNASLPADDYETFGSGTAVLDDIAAAAIPAGSPPPNQVLLSGATASFVSVIDALWAAGIDAEQGAVGKAYVANGARAVRYAEANPHPSWMADVRNDDEFVDRLLAEVDKFPDVENSAAPAAAIEHYGIADIWNRVKAAATALADAALRVVANPVAKALRPSAHGTASIFLGDVMAYLSGRGDIGNEGPIVREVANAITRAAGARVAGDEQLIVVGHSMGGNVCYDVLSHYRPDVDVDLLLTVGSQVGLFEELKLFKASDPGIPSAGTPRVPRLPRVRRWINVFDPADILGYATARVFAGAEDYVFDGGTHALAAHGTYFVRPKFYERLRVRLASGPA